MKQIFTLLFIAIILASCTSSGTLLQNGQYDQAIRKSKKKIVRKRTNEKQILVLEQAYKKANDRDKERIEFLKKEGRPENWDNIFDIYSSMNQRQTIVKPLLPLNLASKGRNADFEILNYDAEIINAKQKAAEYFYSHGLNLLERGDQQSARNAYSDFQQVKRYYNNYKDIDSQMQKAKAIGTSYVIFKMINRTNTSIPSNFEEELTKISLQELNKDWLVYDVKENKNTTYDYTILVNMKLIDVTPDAIKEIHYTDTKEIQDGFQYALDAKGNVKKDTSGNDIKSPKYKTISCNVVETYQSKKAIITGSLDFINNRTGQLIKTDPITAESIFENRSALALGNVNALKPENKAKIGKAPVPFPLSGNMILQAGQTLKTMVKDIIWANKGLLN